MHDRSIVTKLKGSGHRSIIVAAILAGCLAAAGCKQQEKPVQAPAEKPATGAVTQTTMGGPMSDQQKQAMGKAIFKKQCASCHGEEGKGMSAPSLQKADFKYGRTPEAIKETITKGRPGGMPAFGSLQEIEVETVAAYVLSLKR
ncbi:c-type cytochrome [Geobacter hydrogenophilus]|uniref:Cytochrome c n=1 Tax=Geobacter hydrogenophilus TaxID=40983 RepID=A0A9W6LA22_9BACT|nr:c-type cytochrome [Geobacter hydrogenophilus]MBT0895118.1 c-type cytochrome [Geobacter hydrogenophilus]GLI36943.1 cytochrome c [Geobacter hydrogenophilus]